MTATITVIGNTTAAPELRYTASGLPVANFTVASTEKVFDRATNEWKDGKKLFMRCTAWRELAEHVAGSLDKGMRVVVVGKIATREYETAAGEKRSTVELDVDEIGPSLRFATAQVTRASSADRGQPATQPAVEEPWATPGGGSYGTDTPF